MLYLVKSIFVVRMRSESQQTQPDNFSDKFTDLAHT